MDVKKYDELRNEVKEKDFETKNKSLNHWLFNFSYLGNLGSILFAFCLIFPITLKVISANLVQGNFANGLAIGITITILTLFELMKRIVLANLSIDLVKTKWNIFKREVIWWFFLSMTIVLSSAFLSINGAKEFSKTSKGKNIIVINNTQIKIDSITNYYNKRKSLLIIDGDSLRQDNGRLRNKITQTPLNYRGTRKDYQSIIDANLKTIETNDNKISQIDNELANKALDFQKKQEIITTKNIKEDFGNIILFILLSTVIESIIIIGIWFRKYYDYTVFQFNESKLEAIHKKRKNYKILLQFIYKNGNLQSDEPVIGVTKIKRMVKDNANIAMPNKLIEEFFIDATYLGVFKVIGNKRFTQISYKEAYEKIENFDKITRILNDLK